MRSLTLSKLAWLPLVVLSAGILAANSFALTSQDVPSADWPSRDTTPTAATSPASTASPMPLQMTPQQGDGGAAATSVTPAADSRASSSVENGSGPVNAEAAQGEGASLGQTQSAPGQPPPALAASLRFTEDARERLRDGQIDEALRDLARAVSLDASNAFAYFYLGRAYLARKNYPQALTFFRHAVIGFNGRPDWAAEALTYQGLCDEELGKNLDAAQAYKQALALSPNNFRARVGYGRLASVVAPVGTIDAPPPTADLALPAPSGAAELPPVEEPPPPPP